MAVRSVELDVEVEPEVGAAREVRRRRSLPGGRAVVGGFLVAASLVAVFAAYSGAGDGAGQRYVVARRDLSPGVAITAGDLDLVTMDLPPSLASARAFTDRRLLVGSVVVGPIGAGELVQAASVVAKAGGDTARQMAVPVDAGRSVAGGLRTGDRVDVAATFGTGEHAYTLFVVRGAQVLARSEGGGPLGERGGETLTLSLVSADDALALAHAISAGQLTVVRATGAPPAGAEPYRAPSAQPSPPSAGGA